MNLRNLFQKETKQNNEVVVAELPKNKTTNQIIEEIHESFYTEVDRLLEGTKVMKSTETKYEALIKKSEELKALGFTNTKECIEANKEIARLNEIKEYNKNNEELNKAILYFQQKYPLNKFITEDSVKKICEKYNLIYSTIDRYIGTVPDKNLKEIQNFKLKEEDRCYTLVTTIHNRGWGSKITIQNLNLEGYNNFLDKMNRNRTGGIRISYDFTESVHIAQLEIAAPLKDFNTTDLEVKNFKLSKIEIPDPVVLQPVMYNNTKYYLILSAWGNEASDPLVINEINN